MKILSADYILPVSTDKIENGAVVVEDDKIIAVGKNEEITAKFPNVDIESFGKAVITPGFINCHSHLELTVMRGFLDDVEDDFFKWLLKIAVTRDKKLDSQDVENSALLGVVEGIRAGITCFGDIGRYGKAGFKALKKSGLRGFVFQETEFSPHNENAADDFQKLKDKFGELKSTETDLVKAALSPHAPYTVSQKLFENIADYALAEDIKLSIHVAESEMEENLMIHNSGAMAEFYKERGINWNPPGLSSIQYLGEIGVLQAKPLLAHCIRTNEKDWESISENGASIAHCPKSNAKFGHQNAPLEKFLEKSLKVGLGSDSVASNNSCDLLEEGRFAALMARSRADKKRLLTAQEIFEVMTLGGAKAMHLEDKIGSLEIGKQADLTIISLENIAQHPIHDIYSTLLFATTSREIILTMVAGKEIYRDGKCVLIDEDELKVKVTETARKMQEV